MSASWQGNIFSFSIFRFFIEFLWIFLVLCQSTEMIFNDNTAKTIFSDFLVGLGSKWTRTWSSSGLVLDPDSNELFLKFNTANKMFSNKQIQHSIFGTRTLHSPDSNLISAPQCNAPGTCTLNAQKMTTLNIVRTFHWHVPQKHAFSPVFTSERQITS